VRRESDLSDELAELHARVRALEHELQARDEFIIAAAHELRNPISPLVLHVHRLLGATRRAETGTVSAHWLGEQLETFSHRLSRFMVALNRILDISRIQNGGIDLVISEVDLVEVAREVAASFERELVAAASPLTVTADEEVRGQWDRMRLEQIVSNLLSNAIRYGNSQPIELSVRRVGERAVLRVSDRGMGIPEADLVRIFGRFERGDTSNRSGFGVGLWVVKQLCDAMGGDVEVVSSTGAGSVFTVTLPLIAGSRE
jgi:signal transduction histidine kinase